jgi:polyhydroxybutyrate depolymerase
MLTRHKVVLCIGLGLGIAAAAACGDDELTASGPGDRDNQPDPSNQPEGDDGSDALPSDEQVPDQPDPEPVQPDCVAPTATAGTTEVIAFDHDGAARSYRLYVPNSIDLAAPSPLVVNYHGYTSNAAHQQTFSGMDATAEAAQFVVAYPEGISSSWNAGPCCGQFTGNNADDVGFSRALVDDISRRVCIDRRRIYSTGMSNGGMMSEANACRAADVFAAIAPVSGLGFPQLDCAPARPVPMIAFSGTLDRLVTYASSRTSLTQWVNRNGCTGSPTRSDFGASYCETWSQCRGGIELIGCTLTGMGHCWPGQPCPITLGQEGLDIDANQAMWAFLSRFQLPQP